MIATNVDPNRGVFMDTHEQNASRRFKMFGEIGTVGSTTTGMRRAGVATLVSADGIKWDGLAMVVTNIADGPTSYLCVGVTRERTPIGVGVGVVGVIGGACPN